MKHFLRFAVIFAVLLCLQILVVYLSYPDVLTAELIGNYLINSMVFSVVLVLLNYFLTKKAISKEDSTNNHGFLFVETTLTIDQIKSILKDEKRFRNINITADNNSIKIKTAFNSFTSFGSVIHIQFLNQLKNKNSIFIEVRNRVPTTVVNYGHNRKIIYKVLGKMKENDSTIFYQYI